MMAVALMAAKRELPRYIEPMLALSCPPFDADDYLFEIKWDGTRVMAYIDDGTYRLLNRRRRDITERYPEFAFLRDLPAGTVLDGEMIVLKEGKPDFALLQSREQSRTPRRVRASSQATPATYVVFDVLYQDYRSLMAQPLTERREHLALLVKSANTPRLQLSEAVVGKGKAFFAQAVKHDLEGVVAKRLASRYLPGQRTEAWFKIKRQGQLLCAVIGFVPSGPDDFRSLIIAAEQDGKLRCVGKVGSGIDVALRKKINQLIWSRLQEKPVVPCAVKGKWISPGLFCKVNFMEVTPNGDLRAPVLKKLIVSEDS